MKNRAVFSDAAGSSMGFNSTWQRRGDNVSTECQTSKELYQFSETETQSGIATEVVQNQVRSKDDGTTLLDYYCKTHPNRPREVWREGISRGKVTVDCEVTTNVDAIVHSDYFLEYVNFSSDKETQTAPLIQTLSDPTSSSSRQSRRRGESKTEYSEEDEYKDQKDEGYDQEGKWNETKSNSGGSAMTAAMAASLGRLADLVERELESAAQSTAFEGYTIQNSSQNTEEDADVSYWRGLSVDLEKRKVVYPDWTAAKHQAGRLVGCTLSRNRERLYDVEFEDGVRITSVREEHIRLVGEPDSANTVPKHEVSKGRGPPSAAKDGGSKSSSLREGMRVHARAVIRGKTKYLPGRIVKAKAGRFDVECEGSADVQRDLTADDLVVGLGDSATVECRRPVCVQLQATGVSWNATGASLATSYGRTDITGWCDYPGAVCVWNIFGKAFDATQPDYVLDHPSCLLCVAFHPTHPALVAAGSFNGEVVLWDLSVPDHPAMVSPIAEHVHKEPVVNLQWVKALDDEWMLCSAGADGKVLFWCPASGLKHPTTGATLTKGKAARKYVFLHFDPSFPPVHILNTSFFLKSGNTLQHMERLQLHLQVARVVPCVLPGCFVVRKAEPLSGVRCLAFHPHRASLSQHSSRRRALPLKVDSILLSAERMRPFSTAPTQAQ